MPWQYQDDDGAWKPMEKAISQVLDRAQAALLAEGHARCAYSLETPGGKFNYSADLSSAT